jgi:arylformamidase
MMRQLARLAGTSMLVMGAFTAQVLAGSNPLEDFNSGSLTDAFRSSYSGVGGATVNVDVPYGLDESQKYDVYLPADPSGAPVIVMIHGGGWVSGDKQDESVAVAKAGYFVSRGYIFVSLNYRLLPKSDPLVQAADVALGIANIQKNVARWGGDKGKIVLMGHGAGGHLAALLSSNPALASDQGASVWAGAVILETAALNVPALMASGDNAVYQKAFGQNVEFWEDSSPTHLLDSSGVPMLIVCSAQSREETCARANAFKQTADSKGINVTVSPRSISPSDINASLGTASGYSKAVEDYIDSIL